MALLLEQILLENKFYKENSSNLLIPYKYLVSELNHKVFFTEIYGIYNYYYELSAFYSKLLIKRSPSDLIEICEKNSEILFNHILDNEDYIFRNGGDLEIDLANPNKLAISKENNVRHILVGTIPNYRGSSMIIPIEFYENEKNVIKKLNQ